jgi:ketosteroid isomerase-like protein
MKQLTRAVLFSAFLFMAFPITALAQSAGQPDNLAIVKTMYDDFGKGNVPGVLAVIDPKAEWFEAENFIYWEGKPFIGPNAIVNGVFAKIGGEWDYWKLEDLQLFQMTNGMVLGTGRYQAKYKKNGAVIDAQFAHVFTLKDRKVIKFQQYTDTKQVSEAIKK